MSFRLNINILKSEHKWGAPHAALNLFLAEMCGLDPAVTTVRLLDL